MAVGAFPAAKLGVLALKQISKPIANVLKARAKQSPFFRKYICMPPAQLYNYMEVKMKMVALNLGKPTAVPKLTEAMAIELGANLLGETIIFIIGASLLVLEYQRSSRKEALKEQMLMQEKLELQMTINELAFQAERQDTQIREMTRVLAELESRSWTPKILNEIVGGKKKQQQPTDDENNPLELLPEKRITRKVKDNSTKSTTDSSGNEELENSSIVGAINFLIHELNILNYSSNNGSSGQKMKATNAFEKALNDLFIQDYEEEYN